MTEQSSSGSPSAFLPTAGVRSASLRRSLRLVLAAWAFGATWMYVTTGAALTRYAQLLGLSGLGFGVLAALPYAGALVQLPSSYLLERFGHRKTVFITAGIIHRALWLVIALVPWLLPEELWWFGLLGLLGLSSFINHVTNPAWVSWMADLVPARIRGRYFSRRIQLGQMVGVALALASGYVLDRAELVSSETLRITISAAFAFAAVCGVIDFLFFVPVPDRGTPQPNPQANLWTLIREPLADRSFRRFLGYVATMTFATGYVNQFIWLFVFDVGGMSNSQANLLLVGIPQVVLLLSYPMWGKLIDRLGRKPVMFIAGAMVINGASGWIFVSHEQMWPGYGLIILSCIGWPGMELANFNILLSRSQSLEGRRYATAFVAIHSVVTAVAGILSGLFGGLVAEAFSDWQGRLFGWPLTYHALLFFLSAGLRLASLGWLIGLEDQRAYGTRAALRYMGTYLYSNVQHRIFMPGRMLTRLSRWTYKVNPPPKPKTVPNTPRDARQG